MRNYKRKTTRASKSKKDYEEAIAAVMNETLSLRNAADKFNLCHVTLHRKIEKIKTNGSFSVGYTRPRQIFTAEAEEEFVTYLGHASRPALLLQDIRILAFCYAVLTSLKNIHSSWYKNGMAGTDWLKTFLKKHPSVPHNRRMCKNASNDGFFKIYNDILQKNKFTTPNIWIVNETKIAVTEKRNPDKKFGLLKKRFVSIFCAFSAAGKMTPPMFVFPFNKQNECIINGPAGSIGISNSSGKITQNETEEFIEYLIRFLKPTLEKPVLLLIKKLSGFSVNFIKEVNAKHIFLCTPPHCHKFSVPVELKQFKNFNFFLENLENMWLTHFTKRNLTYNDIPAITREYLTTILNPTEIMSAFETIGIQTAVNIHSDSNITEVALNVDHLEVKDEKISKLDNRILDEQLPGPSNNTEGAQGLLPSIPITTSIKVNDTEEKPTRDEGPLCNLEEREVDENINSFIETFNPDITEENDDSSVENYHHDTENTQFCFCCFKMYNEDDCSLQCLNCNEVFHCQCICNILVGVNEIEEKNIFLPVEEK